MPNRLQNRFFYGLIIVASLIVLAIFLPYFKILFIAAIVAVAFNPLYHFVLKMCFGKKTIATLVTLILIFLLIVIPLAFLSFLVFNETHALYLTYSSPEGSVKLADYLGHIQSVMGKFLPDNWVPETTIANVDGYVRQFYDWLGGHFGGLFSNTVDLLGTAFILLLSLFFFFRDGERFRELMMKFSPLQDQYDRAILHKMKIAISSVVKGTILIAIVQGVLAAIGFAVFGLPSPALLVVGLIDNVARPMLIKGSSNIHPFLILLSVFGGLGLFGPSGFLIGPIVLSLLFTLIEMYNEVTKVKNAPSFPADAL